ncbi:MAG: hypothetical protein WBY75_00665, partial [Terracidiphilus sp.]
MIDFAIRLQTSVIGQMAQDTLIPAPSFTNRRSPKFKWELLTQSKPVVQLGEPVRNSKELY